MDESTYDEASEASGTNAGTENRLPEPKMFAASIAAALLDVAAAAWCS